MKSNVAPHFKGGGGGARSKMMIEWMDFRPISALRPSVRSAAHPNKQTADRRVRQLWRYSNMKILWAKAIVNSILSAKLISKLSSRLPMKAPSASFTGRISSSNGEPSSWYAARPDGGNICDHSRVRTGG